MTEMNCPTAEFIDQAGQATSALLAGASERHERGVA